MKYQKISQWKYVLVGDSVTQTCVHPPISINTPLVSLSPIGIITIKEGYAWDGASGPAVDTHDFMLGSLVHDALYQLMRLELLDRSFRQAVDQTLYDLCRAAGMPWWRAQYVYTAVRWFGEKNAGKLMEGDKNTVYEV